MPIVAKTKNIDPKKNKKPKVCVFDVEPAGLNKFLSLSVKPPLELLAIALLMAISSFIAALMSAVCAVFELS